MRVPISLYVSLPVPRISGFKDELSVKIITNAFTVGFIEPEEVEKTWTKIDNEDQAMPTPIIKLIGLVSWREY
jgi:hypothetical protein